MSEDPSSDSTKRERERAGAGQVALVSSPAERGSECDGGRRAVSEPAVARAAASAGERVRRMHTEMPWLRSGWCVRSGGVAWVHAATRLREREQMASERAVPRDRKRILHPPVKNLNKRTPVKNFRQKAVARNDSRDRRGAGDGFLRSRRPHHRKRIGTRKTKNRRAEMDALRRRKTFVRRHSKAVCRVCCATRSALLARRGAPLGRREGAGRHSRLEV